MYRINALDFVFGMFIGAMAIFPLRAIILSIANLGFKKFIETYTDIVFPKKIKKAKLTNLSSANKYKSTPRTWSRKKV
ncbi:MAG: hypothetical protein J6573_04700 [Lactobacillus sp.]|nr:hypothetical protein [Lactobacillus sp.]